MPLPPSLRTGWLDQAGQSRRDRVRVRVQGESYGHVRVRARFREGGSISARTPGLAEPKSFTLAEHRHKLVELEGTALVGVKNKHGLTIRVGIGSMVR